MATMPQNPFDAPMVYRNLMLNTALLNFEKKTFNGKSLACIFLTRYCSVGCPFCYYKSAPAWRSRNIEDQFNDDGIRKFITFSHQANLGYLLVSGGGEPLNQRKHILKLVEHVSADRIVLVTSGNWAKNEIAGQRYIEDIYRAWSARKTQNTLVIRVSLSEGHTSRIGIHPAIHIIKEFSNKYAAENNFKCQIKTFDVDPTLEKVLKHFLGHEIITDEKHLESDNQVLVKKIPKNYKIKFENNLQVVVGVSKIFYSGLRPNLAHQHDVERATKVFDQDLKDCEDDYPAVVFNPTGDNGIDWAINYNGDISSWQNQVRDSYMNLYEDDFEAIHRGVMEDPIQYSFVDKGATYREQILNEVDPLVVRRNKAISLRDTSGAILFEEEKTRLYYAVRVLQDYYLEGKIKPEHIENWPTELRNLVQLSKKTLIDLYHRSNFNIVEQQKLKPFEALLWHDLLELIKLGHYNLSETQKQNALDFYNQHSASKINSYDEVVFDKGDVERRLTERLMHIKPLKQLQGVMVDTQAAPLSRKLDTRILIQATS